MRSVRRQTPSPGVQAERPGEPVRAASCRRAPWSILGLAALALGLAGCGRDADPGSGVVWRSRCDADTLAVGDAFTVELQGRWPRAMGATRLAWGVPGDSLLVAGIDSTGLHGASGREGRDYRLRLISPRPGRVRVPPAALVSVSGETLALAAGAIVRVGGRLPPGAPTDLRPLAPMVSLRRFPWWAAAGAALGLAAGAGLLFWLRQRRRRRAAAEETPLPPPGVEFEEAVRALIAQQLPEHGEMRTFAQELSWILRRYLGRRWERPALASTRPEIISWLPATRLCVRDQGRIATWLEETDRIKFSGHKPLLPDARVLLEAARSVVERTEALFAPIPEEEGGAEGTHGGVPQASAGGEG